MSPSQKSASTTVNAAYNFVFEKCTGNVYENPGPDSNILITSLEPDQDTQMTGTDEIDLLELPDSTPKSQIEECTDLARRDHCIPCVAHFTWRDQKMRFFCHYEWDTKRFKRFELDKAGEYKEGYDFWAEQRIEISHLPQGFHGHAMQGAIEDDRGNAMLFVKMDAGVHWTVKLYGKMAVEGERKAQLTNRERERLGLS